MITFPRTCGTCARFEACWVESSQVMQTIGCPPKDDYEDSKKCPACHEYKESR